NIAKSGRRVINQTASLEIGDPAAKTDGVAQSEEVQPADVERYARAEPSLSCGYVQRVLAASSNPRDLRSETSRDRVLVCLLDLVHDIFVFGGAVRVLNRHIDLCEDTQFVKLTLRLGHPNWRQRYPGM